MKREKRYDFSNLGYVKMLWDLRQEKLGKINSVMSIGIILGMFALGWLSKELLLIMLANMGIGKITSWLVG
jgi:hypothetical protein